MPTLAVPGRDGASPTDPEPQGDQANIGQAPAAVSKKEADVGVYQSFESAVMEGTPTLSVHDRTLIGFIAAVENNSDYWQLHLRRRLQRWHDDSVLDTLTKDWTRAELPIRQLEMLAFALQLTLTPGQMTEADAELLNSVGFSERDLLDIVDVVSYWSLITAVAGSTGPDTNAWTSAQRPVTR